MTTEKYLYNAGKNGWGILLPKQMADFSNFNKKGKIKIDAEPDRLVITRIKEPPTLEALFEEWDGTPYDKYEWGDLEKPIGKELI